MQNSDSPRPRGTYESTHFHTLEQHLAELKSGISGIFTWRRWYLGIIFLPEISRFFMFFFFVILSLIWWPCLNRWFSRFFGLLAKILGKSWASTPTWGPKFQSCAFWKGFLAPKHLFVKVFRCQRFYEGYFLKITQHRSIFWRIPIWRWFFFWDTETHPCYSWSFSVESPTQKVKVSHGMFWRWGPAPKLFPHNPCIQSSSAPDGIFRVWLLTIWMFPKIGDTPKSSIWIGFFPYKPSILGYHYFWKHP